MEWHPAANIFPLMEGEAFASLVADIQSRGQIVPIVLLEGKVLDGRNRWKACEAAKVLPVTVEWDGRGGSPTAFVLSMNRERRHLTTSQWAMVGARAAKELEAEAAERQKAQGALGAPFGQEGGRGHKKAEKPLAADRPQGVSGPPDTASAPEPAGQVAPRAENPSASTGKNKRAPESTEKAAEQVGASGRSVKRAKRVLEKDPTLAAAVEQGKITVDAADAAIRKREKDAQAAVEIAAVPVQAARLEVADATEPWPVEPASVDVIFTSPPYGLDKPYHGQTDEAGRWVAFMDDWLRHAYVAAVHTGRLVLNIPLDTTVGGYRPTWPQACAAAEAAGWTYRGSIVWQKGNSTKGNRGLGSVNSADAPHPIAEVEIIGLFYKGEWKREPPRPSDISPAEWQEFGDGVWRLGGETRAWEGHPAPFSEELARRVVLYLSRVGDVVLDPFIGSGTSALVARRYKRQAIGFDIAPEYVASASRRLAKAQGERNGQEASQKCLDLDLSAGEPASVGQPG